MAVLGDGSSGRAYILEDRVHDLDRLLRAIRAVVAGGSFVDEEIVDLLVRAQGRLGEDPTDTLTDREREVLAQLATGASNASVADSLVGSLHAIEKHITSIFDEARVAGRADGQPAGVGCARPSPKQ
jgi:DNA-binding NarL/FixJ family response regulator